MNLYRSLQKGDSTNSLGNSSEVELIWKFLVFSSELVELTFAEMVC